MATTRQFRPSTAFWEAARIALDSLRKNKLRSFLTLLGIILATTTLISVTALIHGMNLYIAEKVSNMGADGFRIVRMAWFGPWDPKKFLEMQKRNPEIKPVEYEFIRTKTQLVKGVGMMSMRRARVAYKEISTTDVQLQGVTEDIAVSGGNLKAVGTLSIADADQGQSSFQITVTAAAGNLGNGGDEGVIPRNHQTFRA